MENFIVSARKYRPATFDTVVGQGSITATLKNAIKTNQLAHAYLFCGPRGVGKTTCARIFAKTINCLNLSADIEACDTCESCVAFNSNRSYNIHELDAASNNSVEDIRQLIDKVRIPPQIGKHSVYIVDEVHMLSTQAFNAFLKTLEEPPAHAKFVLATTEKHKIIPTILSRCQIFDFNRIKVEDIVNHLASLAVKEGVEADLDALNVVAQKADGGMRDALSFFDQIVSFSGKKITYKAVIENLNVLDYEYYFKLTDGFLQCNISESLLIFNEILDKGFDAHHFITGLSQHFRDVMVCKDVQTIALLEVGANIKERYKLQAQNCSNSFLYNALSIANECDLNYRESKNKRLLVELALIKLNYITNQALVRETDTVVAVNQSGAAIVNTSNTAITTSNVNQVTEKQDFLSDTKTTNQVTDSKNQTASGKVSIKDAIKKTVPVNEVRETVSEQVITEPVKSEVLSNPVNIDEVLALWNHMAESLKSRKPRLYSIFGSYKPEIKDNFMLELVLSSQLQVDAISEIKADLITYLRNKLKNSSIDLVMKISDEKVKTYFTDKDKYAYLNEQNENLEKLKQQFNLDF